MELKKQTGKQKANNNKRIPGWCPQRTSAVVSNLCFQHYPPGTASSGRFHIARLHLHPLLEKTETSPFSKLKKKKKEEGEFVLWPKHWFGQRLSLVRPARAALPGLHPLSGQGLQAHPEQPNSPSRASLWLESWDGTCPSWEAHKKYKGRGERKKQNETEKNPKLEKRMN